MTRSPGFTMVTPSPTLATVPAPSWPITAGSAMVASPFWKWRSLRHTPAAPTLISTSPRLGASSSTVSTEYGLLTSYSTAAVIRMGAPILGFDRGELSRDRGRREALSHCHDFELPARASQSPGSCPERRFQSTSSHSNHTGWFALYQRSTVRIRA